MRTPMRVMASAMMVTAGWGSVPSVVAQDAVAPPSDHELAFVAVSSTDPGVQVVDLETLDLGPYLRIRGPIGAVVPSPDERTVYAVTGDGIVPIPTDTLEPGDLLELPDAARMAISPDGMRAYVTDINLNTVVPVDLTDMTTESPIPLGGHPNDVVYSPDGQTVWVAVVETEELTPIDVATNTVGMPIDVGLPPRGLAITSDGSHVYATNFFGGSGPAEAVLQPIDLVDRVAGPFIPLPGNMRAQDVALASGDSTAYVTDFSGDQLTPVDLDSGTAGQPIACCDGPLGLAISGDGWTAYVACSFGGEMLPIDLTSRTALDGVPTGDGSRDIALVGRRLEPPEPPEPPPAPPIPSTPSFTG